MTETHKATDKNIPDHRLDTLSTHKILEIINQEDKKVPLAIEKELPNLEKAVDLIVRSFQKGGRMIYMGAGTPGRLGILDACECPATFGVSESMVMAALAGDGDETPLAKEKAEDSEDFAINDLKKLSLSSLDIVVAITSSGRTPYALGALKYAKTLGAKTISISGIQEAPVSVISDVAITLLVGDEVLSGSSRMKAGTAQKMVLNMLSTTSMIKMGKVYGNLMVDVQAGNAKLVERQKAIVMEIANTDYQTAEKALLESKLQCKTAILMIILNLNPDEANALLEKNKGFLRTTLEGAQLR